MRADGSSLQWEARDAAEAYLLTWDSARRMTSVLTGEVGIAPDCRQCLVAAVADLAEAADLATMTGAMRAACRAAAG